jgi:chorismate synthase
MTNILRFLTAGESHGKGLIGILEGIPSGLALSSKDIDRELARRQSGYGRGGRMKIEKDHAEIISGVRWGKTIGSPISLLIENRDWENWQDIMSPESKDIGEEIKDPRFDPRLLAVTRPRPGHADLAGALKYRHKDIRNILERSSARETAMRVAIGAIAKKFLSEFSITIGSFVTQIGRVKSQKSEVRSQKSDYEKLFQKAEESSVRCPDEDASKKMMELIDTASKNGDTLGGVFEIFATGLPVGLGSHIQWDKRLDGRLAHALMGIQAIKGVEIGDGFEMAERFGSEVMDEIFYQKTEDRSQKSDSEFYRETNHAGGIEGGMTNGMPIVIRAAMKPIPTLRKPLRSVNIITKEPFEAAYERSDICAVPAAAVIGEAVAALVIADAFLEKFGGDNIEETKKNFDAYMEYLKQF